MNELVIEAKVENLDAVLDFINNRLADCPIKIKNQIRVAVDEIFTNISRYAYHPTIGIATIRTTVIDESIVIEFEDSGIMYNPLEKDDPDISLPAEEREIGGLGIFLVKKLVNSIQYRRENDKNILTVKKLLIPN